MTGQAGSNARRIGIAMSIVTLLGLLTPNASAATSVYDLILGKLPPGSVQMTIDARGTITWNGTLLGTYVALAKKCQRIQGSFTPTAASVTPMPSVSAAEIEQVMEIISRCKFSSVIFEPEKRT